jgi:16S rRNA (guanine966-N2)-methyltransferase
MRPAGGSKNQRKEKKQTGITDLGKRSAKRLYNYVRTMRIIGGKAKGRILKFPSTSKERPTSDFLRETLFNLLGSLEGKSFLDLFAGSGSVGIEAASRGAKEVVLIEGNRKIASSLQNNIAACGLNKECRVINRNVGDGLGDLFKNKYEFDFIFADPPYGRGLVEKTIVLLKNNPVWAEESAIIIQHPAREDVVLLLDEKTILEDQRKYGDNVLTFLKMECS